MLKLIIADDERIIRETISNLIDWSSIGIELVGLCKDGIEAYDMILDESPDIVMTDIKMPGMSGLELIARISQTDLDTQFILLSGYGEFEYAKQAMKYGIRHYLLKPCNEEQIVASMQAVIEDCFHKKAFHQMQEQQKQLLENLHTNIMFNIINEGVVQESTDESLFHPYEQFVDFKHTAYDLCYFYYLEEHDLDAFLQQLNDYSQTYFPGIPFYGVYVQHTLLIFFRTFQKDYQDFDLFYQKVSLSRESIGMEYKRTSFPSLSQLLQSVFKKVRRYGTIYCISNFHVIQTCNYKNMIQQIEELAVSIGTSSPQEHSAEIEELMTILVSIQSLDFLKQLAANLLIKFSATLPSCLPLVATEFLLELNRQPDIVYVRTMVVDKLREIFEEASQQDSKSSDFIERISDYVNRHLSNPNLTLKWIAENYLFMNVDYVSKKFIRETGSKFSNYLTNLRIQKSKELLTSCDIEKISWVAEQVGCGNNPQYFSQIFKKKTGMTPSAYAQKMNGGIS